jgi:hypothetical protein
MEDYTNQGNFQGYDYLKLGISCCPTIITQGGRSNHREHPHLNPLPARERMNTTRCLIPDSTFSAMCPRLP